jgi:cyclopropane-fatty-acyl-phospholipid synthase
MAEESTVLSAPRANGLEIAAGAVARRTARRVLLEAFERLEIGRIEVAEPGGVHRFGRLTPEFPTPVRLVVLDPRFYPRVAVGGSIGAGEAYSEGLWDSDDLTTLVRILARNEGVLDSMEGGLARLGLIVNRLVHLLRPNSRGSSRANIAAHYDLGNDFFSTFLDPTMMYSSAVFPDWTSRLEDASLFKMELIAKKLDLGPRDEVVEIGTGWGGFAIHAAKRYGCRIVTTTISDRQHDYARRRVRDEGLEDRVQVLKADYRDLEAATGRRFDKLVSIEMIEAVGHRYLPRYFAVVSRLLKDDGLALIQAITIPDQRYHLYRRSVDFIQRHIFPGGLLPSLGRISECLGSSTDLRLAHLEDLTPHYAKTLAAWAERFSARAARLEGLGFDRAFRRLWRFYFSYCEGGFLERQIGAAQILLAKPLDRRPPVATVL